MCSGSFWRCNWIVLVRYCKFEERINLLEALEPVVGHALLIRGPRDILGFQKIDNCGDAISRRTLV